MTPPPVKKKRGLWSQNNLALAVASVISGELSQRQAAEKYQIPRRTLRNHLKTGITTKKMGRDPILSKAQENDLVERIIKFAKIGMPLTSLVIRTQAFKFCEKKGIPNTFNKESGRAGRDWLKMFLKRNPSVSERKAQFMNPARAQKLNKHIVEQHFLEIKKIYDELDINEHPERLYNIDEKGCRLTIHHQQKVLAEKGNRRVHLISQEHAENVSIAMCVNAAGNAIPPMILFKGKRLKEEFTDNLPPGSLVKMAPKGSMTTALFINFIDHLGKHKASGKCLLVFDGASCHLDYDIVDAAEKNDIVLYCLPSNTTHELQPLDKSVNKSYEHFWDLEVMKFIYHNPTKKINKPRFNQIFSKVWVKSATTENILSGFRATGLFPFDPKAIPEEAYAPSLLSDHQNLKSSNTVGGGASCNGSDNDMTDIEDTEFVTHAILNTNSPSILTSPRQIFNREDTPMICPSPLASPLCVQERLVDYSSSLDSDDEIKENIAQMSHEVIEIKSPVPGPSGVRTRHSSTTNSSPLLDITDLIAQRNRKVMNFYDLYSDSDDENCVSMPKGYKTPTKLQESARVVVASERSDDSDDDVPLIQIKSKAPAITTFKELIPTPNFAVVKSKPRRKALNYKGQRIVKDLFDKQKSNLKSNAKKVKKHDQEKERKKVMKTKTVKVKRTERKTKKNKNNINLNDNWFCHGCKFETKEDMRRCQKCRKWYHEECVGLTKDDDEVFICPDCI